jgi:hypothetical protein
MAGIVAALVADDNVRPLREPVHDLALAFIAPLRTDDSYIRHSRSSLAETPIDLVRQGDARFRSGVFFTRQLIGVAGEPQSSAASHDVAKLAGRAAASSVLD